MKQLVCEYIEHRVNEALAQRQPLHLSDYHQEHSAICPDCQQALRFMDRVSEAGVENPSLTSFFPQPSTNWVDSVWHLGRRKKRWHTLCRLGTGLTLASFFLLIAISASLDANKIKQRSHASPIATIAESRWPELKEQSKNLWQMSVQGTHQVTRTLRQTIPNAPELKVVETVLEPLTEQIEQSLPIVASGLQKSLYKVTEAMPIQ